MKETGTSEFRIENVPFELFMTFLEYLVRLFCTTHPVVESHIPFFVCMCVCLSQYTGEVVLNPDLAQEMLRVADMYGCGRLKTLCEYEVQSQSSLVFPVYHLHCSGSFFCIFSCVLLPVPLRLRICVFFS